MEEEEEEEEEGEEEEDGTHQSSALTACGAKFHGQWKNHRKVLIVGKKSTGVFQLQFQIPEWKTEDTILGQIYMLHYYIVDAVCLIMSSSLLVYMTK